MQGHQWGFKRVDSNIKSLSREGLLCGWKLPGRRPAEGGGQFKALVVAQVHFGSDFWPTFFGVYQSAGVQTLDLFWSKIDYFY